MSDSFGRAIGFIVDLSRSPALYSAVPLVKECALLILLHPLIDGLGTGYDRPNPTTGGTMSTPRLIDVAARAGVSMKTVSNVVNGTGSFRPETRARVQAAIDEIGYRPNATARRLAMGHTGTISMAISSVTVPYFAQVANLVDRAAREQSLRVVIEQTHGDRSNELAVI